MAEDLGVASEFRTDDFVRFYYPNSKKMADLADYNRVVREMEANRVPVPNVDSSQPEQTGGPPTPR